MSQVSILILDDDAASQKALQQVLYAEGWKVRVVPKAEQALPELAQGDWTLAIANVTMTGVSGPLFSILKDLALAPAMEAGKSRVRVLFLVPEEAGADAQAALERARLPYSLKPLHLHDFLEKVSDLLLETQSITSPIRRVRRVPKPAGPRKDKQTGPARRDTAMFSTREDYQMTEEEITEYEKQEEEETARKKKKKKQEDIV
jgi:DNA-binding response OmpR family regulator